MTRAALCFSLSGLELLSQPAAAVLRPELRMAAANHLGVDERVASPHVRKQSSVAAAFRGARGFKLQAEVSVPYERF